MTTRHTIALTAACMLAALPAGCGAIAPPPVAQADPATVAALDRYSANGCNPSVASVLAGLGIPASAIRGVSYGIYRSEYRDTIIRWDAWVYQTGQPGAVVVTVDEDCQPLQVYARGGARLPNR